MVTTIYCIHCGAIAKHPVYKLFQGQNLAFCCRGCIQVYEMMHADDLLSSPEAQIPSENPEIAAELADPTAIQTIYLHVTGMSCANCAATVERQLRAVPGVLEVSVLLAADRATVKVIPGKASMSDYRHAVAKAGYAIPLEGESG